MTKKEAFRPRYRYDGVRYNFDRMEPSDFAEALQRLNIDPDGFARLTGCLPRRVFRWTLPADHPKFEDIPAWVPVFCDLLAMPGAMKVAEETASFYRSEALQEEDS